KALDAPARFLDVLGLGRIRDAERGTKTERRALHHRHAFRLQQLADEILVGDELMTGRRSSADGTGTRRIDVKRALGLRAMDAAWLVEHRYAKVASLSEDGVVLGDEILWSVERLDRRPLRHRRRIRGRLRLDHRHCFDQRFGPAAVTDAPAGHAISLRDA